MPRPRILPPQHAGAPARPGTVRMTLVRAVPRTPSASAAPALAEGRAAAAGPAGGELLRRREPGTVGGLLPVTAFSAATARGTVFTLDSLMTALNPLGIAAIAARTSSSLQSGLDIELPTRSSGQAFLVVCLRERRAAEASRNRPANGIG